MVTLLLIKNYVTVTDPAKVIVPQLLAKLVVSGACAVNVTAEPEATVNPFGTSSQIV
jgi:hypothetical protein